MVKLNIKNYLLEEAKFHSPYLSEDYLNDIEKQGSRVYISKKNTPWIQNEKFSMIRFPLFNFEVPTEEELEEVVKLKNIFLASYIIRPTELLSPNSVLYICKNENYSFSKLSPSLRRNIRRAQKDLLIKQLNYDELIEKGLSAFCETRNRVGLDDGTEEHFRNKFLTFSELKTYTIWGAFLGKILIAYALVNQIENWAELSLYSSTQYLNYHPNDYLLYYILQHYLENEKLDFLSYGLSSIQLDTGKEGLNQFKVKFLFEPIPIRRVFYCRKNLKFLNKRIIKTIIHGIVKLKPRNRWLKKIEGVISQLN